MWKEDLPTGLPAQHAFETSLQLDTCAIKVLEVNHMHWKSFEPSISFAGCGNRASSLNDTLTTPSMTLTTYSEDLEEAEMSLCRKVMKSGVLKSFVQGLRNLKDLTILMPYKLDQYCGAVHLSDIIPINKTKPHKLSLEHFELSERDIINPLISNHKLKTLSLRDMYLVPQGLGVRVFGAISGANSIESATFRAFMCDSVCEDPYAFPNHMYYPDAGMEDGWDLRDDQVLSAALEKYLIQGGACPLHHNDKVSVRKGLVDPIAPVSG
jgi:hypothetical protein